MMGSGEDNKTIQAQVAGSEAVLISKAIIQS